MYKIGVNNTKSQDDVLHKAVVVTVDFNSIVLYGEQSKACDPETYPPP